MSYEKEWTSYRRRFWTFIGAWLIPPVAVKLLGFGGRLEIGLIAAWLVALAASMTWLYSFRCPRCGNWFCIKMPVNHPFAKACVHCRLPKHAQTDPDAGKDRTE